MRATAASSFLATNSKTRLRFASSPLNFHSTTSAKSAPDITFSLRNLAPSSRSLWASHPRSLSYFALHQNKCQPEIFMAVVKKVKLVIKKGKKWGDSCAQMLHRRENRVIQRGIYFDVIDLDGVPAVSVCYFGIAGLPT